MWLLLKPESTRTVARRSANRSVIDGYQSKDGSRRANERDLTLPNGQTLFLGSSGTGAHYDKKRVSSQSVKVAHTHHGVPCQDPVPFCAPVVPQCFILIRAAFRDQGP